MTRGISEERLLEIRNTCDARDRYAIDLILKECTELNPWIPIDENTPKDKELHLVHADIGQWIGWPNDPVGRNYATHYQELPDDPK